MSIPASRAPSLAPPVPSFQHILLMRTDHLGDMLLTLPMATAIKTAWPTCRISVLASAANAAAAGHHPHVDHVEIDPQESKDSNLTGVRELAHRLRALQCDAAVIVHPTPRLAVAAYLARIPNRVGTAFRAYSILFNRRVRQHRRGVTGKHEAELNIELLQALGIEASPAQPSPWRIDGEDREWVGQLLQECGLEPQRFAVLHPGSAGSAMNWAAEQYAQLGRALAATGTSVAITGGPGEVALTRQVVDAIGPTAVDLGGRMNLAQLAALLAQAAVYVGSSTGPTHLAAAVGTPVVGLYPPLRSTLPQRWRPLGNDVVIVQPEVGQVCDKCLGDRCPFFHCMQKHVEVGVVADAVNAILAKRRSH